MDTNSTYPNITGTREVAVTITSSLNYVLLAIATWILVNMTVHGIRAYRKKLCSKRSWMFMLCYVGVVLNFSRIMVLILLFHLNRIPGGLNYCLPLRRASNSLSAFNLAFTYGLLWLRQKVFHSDKLLKGENYNRYVTMLSWVTLVMLFTSPVLVVFIAALTNNVGHDTEHCVYTVEREEWHKSASWALFIFTVVIQIFLLFLLIFPMAYMRRRSKLFMQRVRCKDKLLTTIKRCVICGLVAVITDVIFLSLLGFLPRPPGYPVLVGDTIANIDLVINDFCIIATFKKAPQILTGAFYKLRSRNSDGISTAWEQRTSTNDV